MQEIINKYERLYDLLILHMKDDQKKEYVMELLKSVCDEMLTYIAQRDPSYAQKMIDKLSAIEWKQYLSKDEANQIFAKLNPRAKWDYNTLIQHLTNLNIEHKEEGQYNCCALWICMSGIYSDHGQTIARMMGKTHVNEIPDHELIPHIHAAAIEKLKDKDGFYEIRKYFDVY
jgi:hypothetical protein